MSQVKILHIRFLTTQGCFKNWMNSTAYLVKNNGKIIQK